MPEPAARTPSTAPELILAFDYGQRRIGLAVGDTLTRSARPDSVLQVPTGDEAPVFDAIALQIKALRPARLIVGCPYHADGTDSAQSTRTRAFAAQLHSRFGLPVELVDERHSSQEASARLKELRRSGQRRRRLRKQDIDGGAAAVILERWFAGERTAEVVP